MLIMHFYLLRQMLLALLLPRRQQLLVRITFHHLRTSPGRYGIHFSWLLLRQLGGDLEHLALLIEAAGHLPSILFNFDIVALVAGGAEPVLELILALLALDSRQFVVFAGGEAEQGGALVAGQHSGLEAAEAVVHLAGLEALYYCEGLALRAVVHGVHQLALLAADVHAVLRLPQHVAQKDGR